MRHPININTSEEGKILFEPDSNSPSNKSDYFLPKLTIDPLEDLTPKDQNVSKLYNKPREPYVRKTSTSLPNQSVKWILGILLLSLLVLILYFTIAFFNKKDDIQVNLEKSESNQQSNSESIADLFSSAMLIKYKDILSPEILKKGCIIITGSYQNKDNAMSEYNRIESNGYTPYIEETPLNTRVGVLFDCSEYDLDGYLIEVRKKFNNKAWYLRPDYNPNL
jgi:hypothetical protein